MSESLEARIARGEKVSRGKEQWDTETLLDSLRDLAYEIGRTPGISLYRKHMGSSPWQLLIRRYGSWAGACRAAGLTPNERAVGSGPRLYSDGDIAAAYERIRALVDRPPTVDGWSELRRCEEMTAHGLRRRYGTWTAFLSSIENANQ